MKTIAEILKMFPRTTKSDWKKHKNGGGWVQITAKAEVSALVEGIVSGNARVFGDARVSGDAWVFGNAWEKSPLQIQGSTHFATNCKYGYISIGCEVHTFAEWKSNYKTIGAEHGYTDEQIKEYKAIVDLFCKIGR